MKTDLLPLKVTADISLLFNGKTFFKNFLSVFTSEYLTGRGSGGCIGTANSANAQRKIRAISWELKKIHEQIREVFQK